MDGLFTDEHYLSTKQSSFNYSTFTETIDLLHLQDISANRTIEIASEMRKVLTKPVDDTNERSPATVYAPDKPYCGSYTILENHLYAFIVARYSLNIYDDEEMDDFFAGACHLYPM